MSKYSGPKSFSKTDLNTAFPFPCKFQKPRGKGEGLFSYNVGKLIVLSFSLNSRLTNKRVVWKLKE